LVIKTLDPYPDAAPAPDPDSLEMLDPDPYSMNPDLVEVLDEKTYFRKRKKKFLLRNCVLKDT
jgi:hypothetical protein